MKTAAISIVGRRGGEGGRLEAMVRRQTLVNWEWVEDGSAAAAPVLVFLGEAARLAPATLEMWAWTLASYPEADYVEASECGSFAMRRSAWLRTAGFDAAAPEFERFGLRAAPREPEGWHDVENVTPELGAPFTNDRGGAGGARNVLLLLPYLEMGGAEKFALEMMEQLGGRRGFRFTVAATLGGEHRWRGEFERLAPDCFTLASFLQLPDYPRFLAYLIESRAIDTVLINNSQFGYQALPLLAALYPRLRCFDFVHSETEYWKSGGYARYSIRYQHFLGATMVASWHLRKWMVERGGAEEKIEVCHVGIDSRLWRRSEEGGRAARERYGVGAGEVVITFAGRLSAEKQPGVMAAALVGLKRAGRAFRAIVVGDGELMEELRGYVADHGLTEVRLLGAVSGEEVRAVLSMTDVLLLPSAFEGVACVLHEAMAMGVAVVTSDAGGQAELVTAECGVVVKRSTPEEEAAAYTRALVELVDDAGMRERMGAAGRGRVEAQFQIEQTADRVAAVLTSGGAEMGDAYRASASAFAAELVETTRYERLAGGLWGRLYSGD